MNTSMTNSDFAEAEPPLKISMETKNINYYFNGYSQIQAKYRVKIWMPFLC